MKAEGREFKGNYLLWFNAHSGWTKGSGIQCTFRRSGDPGSASENEK